MSQEQDLTAISRRQMFSAATAAFAVPAAMAGSTTPQATDKRKPNVVIIIADQVRSDAVGAYGANPMNLTPNIDAMARRGTLYRNMFTNQPVCSPSRACLFTGQYPARHGVWKNTGKDVA